MSLFKIQYQNALNNGAEEFIEADAVESDGSLMAFVKDAKLVAAFKIDRVIFVKSVPSALEEA